MGVACHFIQVVEVFDRVIDTIDERTLPGRPAVPPMVERKNRIARISEPLSNVPIPSAVLSDPV